MVINKQNDHHLSMVMIIIVFTVNAMVYKSSVITMADLPRSPAVWPHSDLTIWNLEAVDHLGFKQKNTAEKMRCSEVLTNYKLLWIMMIMDTKNYG